MIIYTDPFKFLCINSNLFWRLTGKNRKQAMKSNKPYLFRSRIAPIILLMIVRSVYAQNGHLKFEHLSVADNLSNSTVNCIIQDSRGLIWIGTNDGLNKYDGYQFTVYKNAPRSRQYFNSYEVMNIMEDSRQNIWIATKRGGLDLYNRETDQITNIVPSKDARRLVESMYVFCVLEDCDGKIWFGTLLGLYSLDRGTQVFSRYVSDSTDTRSLSNDRVCCLYEDKKQRLWVGTADGLNLFDRDTNSFDRFLYSPGTGSPMDIRGIYEDPGGDLWISVYFGGLIRLNPEKNLVKRYMHDNEEPGSISTDQLFCIAGDGQNNLYIGTENGGLNIFDIQTETFNQYVLDIDDENSINSNSIYSVYVSKNGIIWLGTYNAGVSYTSRLTQGFRHYKTKQGGLNNPYILDIAEDKNGNLWIGTDGGGLNILHKKTGLFKHYVQDDNDASSISANEVTDVFIDSYEQIWVGTYRGGLDLFNSAAGKFIHFRNDPEDVNTLQHNFILNIFEDRDRNLYVGSFTGLDQYDRKNRTFTRFPYPIIQDGVLSMLEDSRGNLWLGTYTGLSFVDKKAYIVINYLHDFNDEKCAVPDVCYDILEDSKGHIWIGAGKGLFRFDRNSQEFIRYQTNEEFVNQSITSIVEDREGNLWLSTGKSILKMEGGIHLPAKPDFFNFGDYEGLRSLFLSMRGDIYFGGNHGLNVLSTKEITQNPYPPPIVLTNLKIFNRDVIIGKDDSPLEKHIAETSKITLTHRQSVFTFEFAALNFIFPEKNKYAFMMEGFEKEWNYVGNQRSATYTNLDPGEYVFRVKGSNNDGIWNEIGASVQIKIIPPWWKTSWAYSIYALSAGLLLFGIWRFQLNKARMKHELELEHLHAEKLEEINLVKSRFFSNVTHEFRTPLSLIMGPIQKIFAHDSEGRFKDQCNLIIRNSQKLYHLINQLLDLSKLEAGHMRLRTRRENIVHLLNEHVLLFSPMAERKRISIQFTVLGDSNNGKDSIHVYLDQERFEKIISNLLSNAIKFTPEGGAIQLCVEQHDAERMKINTKGRNNPQTKKKPQNKKIRNKDKPYSKMDITGFQDQFNQGYVEITVSDNGIGCSDDNIEKIFNRFYQVNNPGPSNHKGTGIGLALTKELIELHYGTITVESAVGKGTIFTVRLPLGKGHLKDDEIVTDPVVYESEDYIHVPVLDEVDEDDDLDARVRSKAYSRKKLPLLLIVEDNADFRKYLYDCLRHDYQVIVAKDGREGLDLSIERIPDLIVSDVMMPGIDGIQLCQKLKSDECTSHIPVILLTAKASEESKIEGLEIGADDYVVKPFEIKELRVRIRNLINQRHQLRMRFNRQQGLKPHEIATTTIDEKFLCKALAIIEKKMSDPDFSVEEFAKEIALSRVQLHRKLRSLTGQSTSEFIRVVRLNRAAQLLKQNHESVTQIAYLVGFNSSSYFSRSFYKHFGVSPSDFVNSKS